MAAGNQTRAPSWVDGQFTVRVRGSGAEPTRIVRVRRPFALIGQIPGADIRVDDPAVDGRHALLLLDRRGVFGVDLRSRGGTRFAGLEAASSWLGPGDILEIAGRRIELLQLRVDGSAVDPPLSTDDPLGDSPGLLGLTLEPPDGPGPPWMLGSALAFVGRGEACAIRVENASASLTHCALLRTPDSAHVIDLLGKRTLLNDRPLEGASALLDGDVLTVGQARFVVRLGPQHQSDIASHPTHADVIRSAPATTLAARPDGGPAAAGHPAAAAVAMLLGAIESGQDETRFEVLDAIRQFQSDTATLLEAQIGRIEALNREIAALRGAIQGPRGPIGPPPVPLRLDLLPPAPTAPGESAGWLLDRLNTLEAEGRSTWKDLLGRIAATVTPRAGPGPAGQSLATTDPETAQDRP